MSAGFIGSVLQLNNTNGLSDLTNVDIVFYIGGSVSSEDAGSHSKSCEYHLRNVTF